MPEAPAFGLGLRLFGWRSLGREEPLAEVDRLRAAGTITDAEREQLRMQILREP